MSPGPQATADRACRALVLLALLLVCRAADASRVRPLNLEQLTRQAERIFSGRCIDVRLGQDPLLGLTVTRLTFEVAQAIKGGAEPTLTFTMLGEGAHAAVAGMPRFDVGEEVILFLYAPSAAGLSSPVGLSQGKLGTVRDKQGRRIAVPSVAQAALLDGVSDETLALLGAPVGGESRMLDADRLLATIGQLVEREKP